MTPPPDPRTVAAMSELMGALADLCGMPISELEITICRPKDGDENRIEFEDPDPLWKCQRPGCGDEAFTVDDKGERVCKLHANEAWIN